MVIDTLLEDVPGDEVLTEEDDATLEDAGEWERLTDTGKSTLSIPRIVLSTRRMPVFFFNQHIP